MSRPSGFDGPGPDATLTEVLGLQSADHLRSLLSLLPRERPRPTRKAEIAAAIERRLAGDLLNELWGRLDRNQRYAVSEVLYGPDRVFHPHRFRAKYGVLPAGAPSEHGHDTQATLLNLFLFAGNSYGEGTALIPADLRDRLRTFVPAPAALTLAAQDELPEAVAQPRRGYFDKQERPVDQAPLARRTMEHAAQHDLLAVLRLVDRGRVAVSAKTRQATAAAARRIADVLLDGDFFDARLDFTRLDSSDELRFLSRYDGLRYFRLNPLGAWCLGEADSYQPRAPAARASLTVFPDLRLQVAGASLTADEALLLETFAQPEAEDVWRLDRDKTLSALESGARVNELREFLAARDDQPLPDRVEGFLATTARRAHALALQGTALLIECADAALAERLAAHERTAKLCRRTGERGLVVAIESEAKFRKALRELGYGMPHG